MLILDLNKSIDGLTPVAHGAQAPSPSITEDLINNFKDIEARWSPQGRPTSHLRFAAP